MSCSISEEISLFRDRIENRSFGDETLRILEYALASRNVESLTHTRSVLRKLLTTQAKLVLREMAGRVAYDKLFVVEFFARALAFVGDVESCLALKYEALVLRELECVSDDSMRVLCEEWLTFSEDSMDNGYYSIALKGLNNALSSIQAGNHHNCGREAQTVRRIEELKQKAEEQISPHSVRAKASDFLKRKAIRHEQNEQVLHSSVPRRPASLLYQAGLRTRNEYKLRKSQELTYVTD